MTSTTKLGYTLFDADNHYYETEDAFFRYMEPSKRHKAPRWVEIDGSRRLMFGDRMNRFLGSDHTFSKTAAPGVLLKGRGYGELTDTPPEFQRFDARQSVMDEQGVEGTLVFGTLVLSVEQLLIDDIEGTYANLHAFNRWLADEWPYNHENRIYGVPMLSLLDPVLSIEEIDFVIGHGARAINLRCGPVGGRSPADRVYDPFWARVQDADVAVVFHAVDDPYRYQLAQIWGWDNPNVPARNIPGIQRVIAGYGRPIHDTIASLIYGKLFERFPKLRVASIELGCDWAIELADKLARAPRDDLAEPPLDTLRRHVWVNPYSDEDLRGLIAAIGPERVMFGSDWPHTDGMVRPIDFADALADFDDDQTRKIMRDNARSFVTTS